MCGLTCNGNGNVQRLASILKAQKALLSEMHDRFIAVDSSTLTPEARIRREGHQEAMSMLEDNIARTSELMALAQERAQEKSANDQIVLAAV
ncbi:hypothetical protein ACI2KR_06615 [Pseudomonas luteola]